MIMKDFVRKLMEYRAMRDRPLTTARIDISLKNLLRGLLEKDIKKRLTAQQVTKHPFFEKTMTGENTRDSWTTGMNVTSSMNATNSNLSLGAPSPAHRPSASLGLEDEESIMKRAMTFRQASHFEKAIMSIASYQEASEEIDNLRAVFMKLDVAGNGTISLQELEKGVKDCGISMTQAELRGLFNALDRDRTGKIHFCEFLAGTLHPSEIASQKAINDVFDFFDIDRSGKVKREELVEMLGDEAAASNVMMAAKAEGKGYLSKQEFALLMQDIAKKMEARFHSIQTSQSK
jgi:Ca2+-binding EF-hand superfamily protein